jgi:tetratricopeptide (TPR) repeat protein
MKKKVLLIMFLFGLVQVNIGQTQGLSKKDRIAYEEADSYIAYGDFKTAAEQFEKLYLTEKSNPWIKYKLGYAYYKLHQYDSAKPLLQESINTIEEAKFYLAEVLHYQSYIDEAELMLKSIKSSKIDQKEIDRLLGQIDFARDQFQNPKEVTIKNSGTNINSEYPDYVPLITANEDFLYYTSRRPNDQHQLKDVTGQYYEEVYSSVNIDGEWTKAIPIKGSINTEKHDACVGLSPDGNSMFLFKTNTNLVGGDLYESQQINGFWSAPLKMSDKINGEFSIEPSASISIDDRTFYFSSNREGGFGGFDLYRVIKLPNGEWSEALNLGDQINTPYDDDAPFIHPDGKTLYFSSKGHQTMGGFDVFKTKLNGDNQWGEVENLGFPINTTTDDIYFVISANEQHGYYSSAKAGGEGSQDIYRINYLEKSLRQSVVKAQIPSIIDNPNGASVTVYDLRTNEIAGAYTPRTRDGRFIFLVDPNVEYEIVIESVDFEELIKTVSFSLEELMGRTSIEFKLKKIDLE